jgi:hypothetical protein
LPQFVVGEDHGVYASGPKLLQALSSGVEQGTPDALAAAIGVNGEPVQVRSPAVPAGNEGTNELRVGEGDKASFRVTRE